MTLRKRLSASLALTAAVVLAAQSVAFAQEEAAQEPVSIVATTEIMGSIVGEIAGEAADVTTLMPAGVDPHAWAPSARDVERVMQATLVVENGLGLEEGLLAVLDEARAEGIPVFTASDHITVRMQERDHAAGEEHHDHGGIAHACGHFDDDPVDVSADGTIPEDHTRYTVALSDGSAAVTLERDEAGAVSFFLGTDVPFSLTDEAGAELDVEETKTVGDECDAVATVATFDLAAGAYTLALGPTTGVSAVDLVWEEASHADDHADDHAEGEGDHEHEGEYAEGDDHQDHEGDHDHGHSHGPEDPHIWLDPVTMGSIVEAMVPAMAEVGIDVNDRADAFVVELAALDAEIEQMLAGIPDERRKIVSGHEALGYYADRYGLEQVGAVIPSLSTSGDPSAQDVAALIRVMDDAGVTVVFTDVGTPQSIAEAVADATGADVVPLSVEQLPADGSYVSFMRELTKSIAGALGS